MMENVICFEIVKLFFSIFKDVVKFMFLMFFKLFVLCRNIVKLYKFCWFFILLDFDMLINLCMLFSIGKCVNLYYIKRYIYLVVILWILIIV